MNRTYEQLNYGVYRQADGAISEGIYDYPHKAFFAAFCEEHETGGEEVIAAVPLMVEGRTYTERKENLVSLAVEIMGDVTEFGTLSQGEMADLASYFERMGRRYGLLREFRENAVC